MFSHSQFALSSTSDSGASYLHATLERIDQLANDVQFNFEGTHDQKRYLVVDTNILLSHLDALQDFVEDVQHLGLTNDVAVVVPGAVIGELDGQKNRDGLAWFARRASAWVLAKVRERSVVRGQADEETCKLSENWKKSSPEDREQVRLASLVIISFPGLLKSASGPAYTNPSDRPSRLPTAEAPASQDDDMSMDVDEQESLVDYTMPSHPLDLLHIQICEHFSTLLVELVSRVGGDEIDQARTGGAAKSKYAPSWTRNVKPIGQWTPTECMEYLNDKRRVKPTAPPIDVFLTKKSNIPGQVRAGPARRGQDWSRADWEVALTGLQTLGNAWEEGSFQESLAVLAPHLYQIFSLRMRPTGI
ncbi:hypothetical protein ONZ45_g3655 [Pleurotus djamor]|nr:hypothetical protein ONZ45_g3655 [Pleurotus djamor]